GAVFSILEDIVILILPIPCISKLNIRRGKKVSLITLFSIKVIYIYLFPLLFISSLFRHRFANEIDFIEYVS
ncbi:hypothetical protein BKA61DRAFT_487270, partial [Leptodontidium sp. MPI-SDFR-AT-0119]